MILSEQRGATVITSGLHPRASSVWSSFSPRPRVHERFSPTVPKKHMHVRLMNRAWMVGCLSGQLFAYKPPTCPGWKFLPSEDKPGLTHTTRVPDCRRGSNRKHLDWCCQAFNTSIMVHVAIKLVKDLCLINLVYGQWRLSKGEQDYWLRLISIKTQTRQSKNVSFRVNPKSLCNYFLVLSVLLECCRCRQTWGRMEESKGAGNKKTSRGNRQESGMKESTSYWANGKTHSKDIRKE